MSYKSGFYKGRLGIGLANNGGDGSGNPRFPLDINGDIRLTGSLLRSDGTPYLGGGLINYIPKGIKSILNNDGSYSVGFGTHTPTEALDISGNLKISGQVISVDGDNFSSVVPITQQQTTTENPTWHGNVTTTVSSSTDSASGLALKANIASPTFTGTVIVPNLNITGNFQMNGQTPTFSNWTKSGDHIYRNVSGGNVGIGTSSPGSHKLNVNGSINGTTLYINGGKLIRVADGTDYGGIKLGYGENGKNYPVELSSGKAYVNVPWTDNNTTYGVGNGGLTEYNFTNALLTKLAGIAESANNYILPATRSFTSLTNGNLTINSNQFYVNLTGDAYFNYSGGGATYIGNASALTRIGSTAYFKTNGNVGIGTSDPGTFLEVHTDNSNHGLQITRASSNTFTFLGYDNLDCFSSSTQQGIIVNGTAPNKLYIQYHSRGDTIINSNGGYVGIGTTGPFCPLQINGSDAEVTTNSEKAWWSSGETWTTAGGAYDISLYTSNVIWCGSGGVIASSDQRIKTNIREVPDNLSLQTLRDISCCYYEYKDKVTRGSSNTIGFIAQQVKEHMPMAVGIKKKIIPNEMRKLTNIIWNDTILTTDLQDVSGVKYRFYVSNDISGNDEIMKEIIGNSDNTFTFEKQWDNVFCYGKEVDDFHTLDKNKLFSLNFSATQELDKQQQTDKAKISELENKVSTLESELAAIKAHLGI